MVATRAPIARDEVSPGESIPAACTSGGWRLSRRLEECLHRQPVVLVIVLPVLILDRRSQQHDVVRRAGQMCAKAVAGGVRQRIDEPVDQSASRGTERGIFTAAWIDAKRLA